MGEFIAELVPWLLPIALVASFLVNSKEKLPGGRGKSGSSDSAEKSKKSEASEDKGSGDMTSL